MWNFVLVMDFEEVYFASWEHNSCVHHHTCFILHPVELHSKLFNSVLHFHCNYFETFIPHLQCIANETPFPLLSSLHIQEPHGKQRAQIFRRSNSLGLTQK
jgi:hypothetical protein